MEWLTHATVCDIASKNPKEIKERWGALEYTPRQLAILTSPSGFQGLTNWSSGFLSFIVYDYSPPGPQCSYQTSPFAVFQLGQMLPPLGLCLPTLPRKLFHQIFSWSPNVIYSEKPYGSHSKSSPFILHPSPCCILFDITHCYLFYIIS